MLDRLKDITHNEFPIPRPYPIVNPILPSQPSNESDRFLEDPLILRSTTPTTPRTLPPVPPFPGSATSVVPETVLSPSQSQPEREQLPIELLQLLEQALQSLRTNFSEKPPHTVQRLSELVLYPTRHYRTLPAWLRAVDRVVSVSSGADVFPLSDVPPDLGISNGILNGPIAHDYLASTDERNGYDKDSLGSDESLGGALLTPIPWLSNSDISSSTDSSTLDSSSKVESWQDQASEDEMLPISEVTPAEDAAQAIAAVAQGQLEEGIVPERANGALTQGELIRMEQEAGVAPVPHEDIGRIGDEGIEIDDEGENMPHATGPDLVGTIDMGKVGGEERQVRISSPPSHDLERKHDPNDAQEVLEGGTHKVDSEASEATPSEDFVEVEKDDVKSKSSSDEDGDIVFVDADGTAQDASPEDKADSADTGEDAADASAQ